MRSKRRARLRAVGLVGVPILLLLVNFGLWWGEEYLKNYVAAFPTNHFFADDYELQTLLEIKENVVSGAHRVAQSGFQQLLNGILGNNKQDIKQILGNILQPETFHLGLVRAGDYCLITTEVQGEIWCQPVLKIAERDGVPSWSWPPQQEGTDRPYLFTKIYPQLYATASGQMQTKDIQELSQRLSVYWLKPSRYAQLEQREGHFYLERLPGTVLMTREESANLWAHRIQLYRLVQMLFVALLLAVSPISLTIFYKNKLGSLFKALFKSLRKWKRQRDREREKQVVSVTNPQAVELQEGGTMSQPIEEEEGTGLLPRQYYPATARNPLMGTILSVGLRWKTGTEMKNIERLTELITVKTKLSEASVQQLEAEKQLVMKLAESGGITPKLIDKLEAQGYYRLVTLLRQREELQDLDHQDVVLTKKLSITEKQRQLEELKNPPKPKRRMTPQEWEDREIRRLRREVAFQIRSGVARADAVEQERRAAKARATQKHSSDPESLKKIHDRIDLTCDQLVQFQGTEYEEDDNIL